MPSHRFNPHPTAGVFWPYGPGFCLWLAMATFVLSLAAAPARAQDMAYVKDLPTPAEIAQRFAVSDLEQSLGRQCAALDMLWRGMAFFTIREVGKPEMQAARQQYSDAIKSLRERYAREVRPLDTPEAERRWSVRLCGNAPDGVHPMTGKPDKSFPGLKQRVTTEEVVSLFKPSVKAAYERRLEEGKRAQAQFAASEVRRAEDVRNRKQAASTDDQIVLLGLVAQTAGWGLMIWLIFATLTRRAGYDTVRRLVRIGMRDYALASIQGVVTGAPQKSRETVVTGGGGGGGPTNAPVSVSVSSYSITHDTIFVKDDQGKVHHLQLRNWDFPCADGHEIDAMWLERNGKWVGDDYVMVRNFTIDNAWSNTDLLAKRIAPLHEGGVFILLVLASVLTVGVGIVLAVPAWFWMRWQWRKRAKTLAAAIRDGQGGHLSQAFS